MQFIDFYFLLHLVLKIAFIKFSLGGLFGYSGGFVEDDTRGFLRPNIEGLEFAVLAFFMHLGSFRKKKNWKDLLFIILASVGILLDLTRQSIFFSALLGAVYILKSSRYKIILTLVIAVFLYFLPNLILKTKLPIIKDLVTLSQDQFENNKYGEKDIRLVEAEYFTKDFNESIPQVIFGNGLPHANSDYGKKMVYLSENKSFYSNDIGYVHILIYSGIVGLVLYLLLFYNLLRYPVLDEYLWCKFYLLYILFTNIASQTMSISGITIGIAVYFMICYKKKNTLKPI